MCSTVGIFHSGSGFSESTTKATSLMITCRLKQASIAVALILALARYPRVQKECQDELDRVIGAYQLPKPSDVDSLPYLHAVIEELIRWHSVAPLGQSYHHPDLVKLEFKLAPPDCCRYPSFGQGR